MLMFVAENNAKMTTLIFLISQERAEPAWTRPLPDAHKLSNSGLGSLPRCVAGLQPLDVKYKSQKKPKALTVLFRKWEQVEAVCRVAHNSNFSMKNEQPTGGNLRYQAGGWKLLRKESSYYIIIRKTISPVTRRREDFQLSNNVLGGTSQGLSEKSAVYWHMNIKSINMVK